MEDQLQNPWPAFTEKALALHKKTERIISGAQNKLETKTRLIRQDCQTTVATAQEDCLEQSRDLVLSVRDHVAKMANSHDPVEVCHGLLLALVINNNLFFQQEKTPLVFPKGDKKTGELTFLVVDDQVSISVSVSTHFCYNESYMLSGPATEFFGGSLANLQAAGEFAPLLKSRGQARACPADSVIRDLTTILQEDSRNRNEYITM